MTAFGFAKPHADDRIVTLGEAIWLIAFPDQSRTALKWAKEERRLQANIRSLLRRGKEAWLQAGLNGAAFTLFEAGRIVGEGRQPGGHDLLREQRDAWPKDSAFVIFQKAVEDYAKRREDILSRLNKAAAALHLAWGRGRVPFFRNGDKLAPSLSDRCSVERRHKTGGGRVVVDFYLADAADRAPSWAQQTVWVEREALGALMKKAGSLPSTTEGEAVTSRMSEPMVEHLEEPTQSTECEAGARGRTGRPKGSGSYEEQDRAIAWRMHEWLQAQPKGTAVERAADQLVGDAVGHGTDYSKRKRLTGRYRQLERDGVFQKHSGAQGSELS